MTQTDKLLKALQKGEWLTSLQILDMYILNYKGRISDLRKMGYQIESEKVPDKPYFRYRLKNELIKRDDPLKEYHEQQELKAEQGKQGSLM